ncbi:MAG: hypothetical protein IPJ98_18740 [Bryobacterales bacterium]|nr:hypothetical protein [Bryobacterales bacterium]
MRIWLTAVLLLAPTFTPALAPARAEQPLSPIAEADPPKCEKAIRSQFWPQEANGNPRATMRLAREGKLLICTRDVWRYKWRPVTFNIQAATAKASAAADAKAAAKADAKAAARR